HTPRCTVDGIIHLGGLSADGRTLLVSDFSVGWLKHKHADSEEPVQIRLYDTHSGRVVESFDRVTRHAMSPDGGHAALQVGRDVVVLDLATRMHWTLHSSDDPVFSPIGKWLWVRQQELSAFVDVKSGQIVCRLTGDSHAFYCDDRYVSEGRNQHDFELFEAA